MKPKWTPIKIRLGDMTPWGENPRMSTKAQAQRIIESEKKFNQVIPFIVSPIRDGGKVLLYDGHQRLSAWLTIYGTDYQMDAMQSDRELTEAEHKELVITLHTGATGEWNWNMLSSWSAPELKAWGMNEDTLKTWGQDYSNLKGLLVSELSEEEAFSKLPDQDRAPFQQMTFTLHDDQAETVKEAIKVAKAIGAFIDTGNENSNGNALARICELFLGEHGNG